MRRRLMAAAACLLSIALLPAGSSTAATPRSGASVPLSLGEDGHDTVPVYVDGKGPYPFILDTGADGSAVYQWFAEQARLEKKRGGEQELSGQTGSARVSVYPPQGRVIGRLARGRHRGLRPAQSPRQRARSRRSGQ
ncbi:MAG: aspartyl protease family protein [Caulobacteraceae bacterium]|nr:aspartyl protease family protein [Caulobacteraceae bacterium]